MHGNVVGSGSSLPERMVMNDVNDIDAVLL